MALSVSVIQGDHEEGYDVLDVEVSVYTQNSGTYSTSMRQKGLAVISNFSGDIVTRVTVAGRDASFAKQRYSGNDSLTARI